MTLVVREPGILSTIQDGGRPGFGALGVPVGGAMDPRALAIANLLLGNERAAAALEMTIAGPELEVAEATVVGLAGADLGGVLDPSGRRLRPGRSYRVEPGSVIAFRGSSPGVPMGRAYLALPGGIDVPVVLGSRSTCLAGRFGGIDGRPLRAGDRLRPLIRAPLPNPLVWPEESAKPPLDNGAVVVRVLPGPILDEATAHGTAAALRTLLESEWTVRPDSDRMGMRLEGPGIEAARGELVSHGVAWGAVQLPPSGSPIVLLADHQSIGGYPVLAVAISADRPVLGQLVPGDRVHFRLVEANRARVALAEDRERLARLARQLDEARRLEDAARWAGA